MGEGGGGAATVARFSLIIIVYDRDYPTKTNKHRKRL